MKRLSILSIRGRKAALVLWWPAVVLSLVGVFRTFWPEAASGSPVAAGGLPVLCAGLVLLAGSSVVLGRHAGEDFARAAWISGAALLLTTLSLTVLWVAAANERTYEQQYPFVSATVTGCKQDGETDAASYSCLHHAVVNDRAVNEWHYADKDFADGHAVRVRANPVTGHLKAEVWIWSVPLEVGGALIGLVAALSGFAVAFQWSEAWPDLRDGLRAPVRRTPADAVPADRV